MKSFRDIVKRDYHILRRVLLSYRRIGLKNRNFSIISNNCTAGYIYQYFGLEYQTPTIGIFFTANDYVKIVANPQKYFQKGNLRFIAPENSVHKNLYKSSMSFGKYPVAELDDIEVFFMHYKTEKDAEQTWYRRCERINYNNVLFLFTENESFSLGTLDESLCVSQKNKVCMTYNDYRVKNPIVIRNTQVKANDGNIAWTPKIILASMPWKRILNHLGD